MTEAEWLKCTSLRPMLAFFQDRVSERKLRLFGCGCCRRIWPALTDERSRRAVDTAERFADGEASLEQLQTAHTAAHAVTGFVVASQAASAPVAARDVTSRDLADLLRLPWNAAESSI